MIQYKYQLNTVTKCPMKTITIKQERENLNYHLSLDERKMIEKMLNQGISRRQIAKVVWKWKTSICDEVKNNSTFHDWYKAHLAHKLHLRKSLNKGNISKIENSEKLREYIKEKLLLDWSPEEISWRLKLFHSDTDLDTYIPHVCHETIYHFIYESDEWKKLKLAQFLRRHKKKRTKWHERKKKGVEFLKDRVSIHKRPKKINQRKEIWDWESDSVLFSKQKPVLNVNIERKSRLTRFELVRDKSALSSIAVQKHIVYEMEELGVDINSFTFDNGTENVLHIQLNEFGVKTYFCDAYSSWQKGAVENMNMFIRQYLPRKTDVSCLTSQDIYIIQEKLNNRPRKCLGYLTPNEFFYRETGVKIE